MHYMAFPRAIALAEKAWTEKTDQNWDCFIARMEEQLARLSTMKVAYRPLVEQ